MLDLSRRLGLNCVAEGIETEQQMAWLRERGCNLFQGFLIGTPMSLDLLMGLGFRAQLQASLPVANAIREPQGARLSEQELLNNYSRV